METHRTACILCSRNCGILVDVDPATGRLGRIRGDDAHVVSQGYVCQKAARLDRYQNHADRLSRPLRRRSDGTFEPVSWDEALGEIATRLLAIRDAHGGRAFAFYGGGGQGNHLGGIYGHALLAAMGSQYHYSALAQEKTGDFWVNGRLFGRQTCHTTEDVEHAEMVIFIGTNPWQAHGIRNARDVLKEIQRDPRRTMVVIDPRRTETAELADVHLQLRPGTDAFLLAAMIALVLREGLEDQAFLEARTTGLSQVRAVLDAVPVEDFVARAGVELAAVRDVVARLGRAASACVRVDLGLQQGLHSTLASYLEKLLYLVTGNFGRPGTNGFHSFLLPLIGHADPPGSGSGTWATTATGFPAIGKLFPPSVLPEEIASGRPDRIRALWVDSANPVMSGADTRAYREALGGLDLMVVVDVAMTETARLAHYVLPASSQLEKWEATFFTLEFPTNAFHLRAPLLPPTGESLPEPEIYLRLLRRMGLLPGGFPVLRRLARWHRRLPGARLLPLGMKAALARRPHLAPYAAFLLYDTLGRELPGGAAAAAPLWFAALRYAERHGDAVRRTGLRGSGAALGEALFERILSGRSGALLSTHRHEDTWSFVRHDDGRIHLAIPELLAQVRDLGSEPEAPDGDLPMVLVAGERRSYNANTIFRDPAWRKQDPDGALRVHPADAARLGLSSGAAARVTSRRGVVEVRVKVCDTVREGMVTLPHGYGTDYPGDGGERRRAGPAVNDLTEAGHRDPIAATPFHKFVRVRVEPAAAPE